MEEAQLKITEFEKAAARQEKLKKKLKKKMQRSPKAKNTVKPPMKNAETR